MKHTHHYVITALATPVLVGSGIAIMLSTSFVMGLISLIVGILLAWSTITLIRAGVFQFYEGDDTDR